jgi:hypothetical protein
MIATLELAMIGRMEPLETPGPAPEIKTIEYRSRPTRIIGERFYIYASKKWAGVKLSLPLGEGSFHGLRDPDVVCARLNNMMAMTKEAQPMTMKAPAASANAAAMKKEAATKNNNPGSHFMTVSSSVRECAQPWRRHLWSVSKGARF